MDEQLTNEQQGNFETDNTSSQENVENLEGQESSTEQDSAQDNTQDGAQDGTGTQQQSEKIKIEGLEGEFTPEEILEQFKNSKQKPVEQEQVKYREEKVIDSDIERINGDMANESASMLKKYLALANVPQDNINAPYNALVKGVKTGDFEEFIGYLNPSDVQKFILEQINLTGKYTPELEKLGNEKKQSKLSVEYANNIKAWDAFIDTECKDNPALAFFLNEGKKDAYFDKEYAGRIKDAFNKAVAMTTNKKVLNEQTDAIKKAMMNSVITSGVKQKQHIYTNEEIGKMSQKEYNRVEKIIDEQFKKGLIK